MTKPMTSSGVVWLAAVAAGLVLVACGGNEVNGAAVTGVALSDAPVTGTVTLADSSAQQQQRLVATRADGSFSVDVAGLTPPYMLRVEWADAAGAKKLYAVTEGNENLDVNPITDVAFGAASGGSDDEQVFQTSSSDDKREASTRASALLVQLRSVLAPLFERYGITDPRVDKAAVRVLLEDVRVRRDDGVVTVTNRETGKVIFTGRLSNLAAGTFTAANMPAGPGTTPPPTTTDGAALYATSCASCHGGLASSQVRGESASSIAEAIAENEGGMGTAALRALSGTQLSAIATALRSGTTPPAACTYTYSAWSTCSSGAQTRTVLASAPAGCSGTPVLSQACGTTPPPDGAALYTQYCAGCHGSSMLGSSASSIQSAINSNRGGMGTAALRALTPAQVAAIAAAGNPTPATCSSFTYSAYGACQPNNTQTRSVLTSSPAGCTGGAPVTSQACTYVPPVTTCSSFTYSAYGACQPNNTQTRSVLTSSPAGCTGGAPVTMQACTYVPPVTTCSSFTYSAYGACQPNNTQTRSVLTSSPAGCTGGAPVTSQACTYVPPVTTCSSFTYSAYGACQPNNTQTRSVLTSSPAGCTGGAPVTMQACTYTPPLDGTALYNQYCAGCHGNSKKGASASSTQSAINSNRGGMGSAALRALTPAQLAAIAAAP